MDEETGVTSGQLPSGRITYTFRTVANTLYDINFGFGALGGGSELLSVEIAGITTGQFAANANNDLNSTFSNGAIAFIATGDTTTVSFFSQGLDNVDAVVDNISITGAAVPEPATWAMMIGGMGLIGAGLRRRRSVRTNVTFA